MNTEPPSQAAEDATIRAGLAAFNAQQQDMEAGPSWLGRAGGALQDWVKVHRLVTAGVVACSLAACVVVLNTIGGSGDDPFAELHKEIETALLPPPASKEKQPAVKPGRRAANTGTTRDPVVADRLRLAGFGPLRRVETHPVSAVPMDVGEASYFHLSQFLKGGPAPARGSIQVDELVNAIPYLYRDEADNIDAVGASVAIYPAPWGGNSKLLHIGIRFPAVDSIDQMRAWIRFNPEAVSTYRLLGREAEHAHDQMSETTGLDQLVRKSVQKNEIGNAETGARAPRTGTVTAIYEVTPVGRTSADPQRADVARLSVRYMPAIGEPSQSLSLAITQADAHVSVETLSDDMRFGAAVAAFGQKFKGDPRLSALSYDHIQALAEHARGDDPSGRRGEFIDLMGRTESSFALGLGAAGGKASSGREN